MSTKTITLEEALHHTGPGFGKFNIGILFLSGFTLVGMIFETLGLSYIIPAAQCDLNLTLFDKGWLGAIPFIGIILTTHLWGWLADTRGRKQVIMFSMAVGSFFSILSSFSPDLITFASIKFISSLFVSCTSSVPYAYLGEFNNASHRDRMVTIGASFICVGVVFLPALAWSIQSIDFRYPIEFLGIDYRPWRLLVVVFALPYIVCSLVMITAPESPKFLACIGKNEETMKVLRSMYAINTGKKDDPFENLQLEVKPTLKAKSVLRSMWDQTIPLFQRPLLFYTCIAFYVQFANFSCANGFYMWWPQILNSVINEQQNAESIGTVCDMISVQIATNSSMVNKEMNLVSECNDTVQTGTFLTVMIISGITSVMMFTAGFVVNILGKRNILIGINISSGLAAYAIYWSTNANMSIFLLGLFQSIGICIGMMNAVVVEIFPTHLRAMAVGLALVAGRFGSIMGSNIMGLLIDINCPSSFFLFGSILLVSSGICLLIPKPGTLQVT